MFTAMTSRVAMTSRDVIVDILKLAVSRPIQALRVHCLTMDVAKKDNGRKLKRARSAR